MTRTGRSCAASAEQRQHRETQQEPIHRQGVDQPEGGAERPALRIGELDVAGQQRSQQLVERGVGQLLLRLAPAHPQDGAIRRRRADLVEQRRLPDARLAVDDEHAAASPASVVERLGEPSACSSSRPSSVVTSAR